MPLAAAATPVVFHVDPGKWSPELQGGKGDRGSAIGAGGISGTIFDDGHELMMHFNLSSICRRGSGRLLFSPWFGVVSPWS